MFCLNSNLTGIVSQNLGLPFLDVPLGNTRYHEMEYVLVLS